MHCLHLTQYRLVANMDLSMQRKETKDRPRVTRVYQAPVVKSRRVQLRNPQRRRTLVLTRLKPPMVRMKRNPSASSRCGRKRTYHECVSYTSSPGADGSHAATMLSIERSRVGIRVALQVVRALQTATLFGGRSIQTKRRQQKRPRPNRCRCR